eukprot:gene51033-68316_t
MKVDYSQRVGPSLPVHFGGSFPEHLQGRTHILQTYLGETQEIAVK